MAITSAIVLFAVIWFMTFFIALPIRVTTQGDAGKVEPGTHAGAPEVHNLKKKALITTAFAVVIWAISVVVILSGVISLTELDLLNRLTKPQG